MATLDSVGRRLSATRELDLTKYYFYQYPNEANIQRQAGKNRAPAEALTRSERKRLGSQDEEEISSSWTTPNQSQQWNSSPESLSSPNSSCGRAARRLLKQPAAANCSADDSECEVVIKSYSRLCEHDAADLAHTPDRLTAIGASRGAQPAKQIGSQRSAKMLERATAAGLSERAARLGATRHECASSSAHTKVISQQQQDIYTSSSGRTQSYQQQERAQHQAATAAAQIVDLNLNHSQRKPSIEEQLRHLLELEPPVTARRKSAAEQLRSAAPIHANDKLDRPSAISSQLQAQLTLVRKPHIHQHQSATTARILQEGRQQAMINPADRMMIFMLASKRAAALHEGSRAAKDKLVLEWLEDCARAQRNNQLR